MKRPQAKTAGWDPFVSGITRSRAWKYPWLYFSGLLLLDALLSYGSLSLRERLFLFVFGFLPFFLAAWIHWPSGKKTSPLGSDEFLPPGNLLLLLSLLALAVFLRFFSLDSLSTWPIHDEGRTSYFAMRQAEHWDWKLLYGYNQLPPFFYWAFASFYRVFPPSLFALWLFPALLSVAILGLGYIAARCFFSRSLALVAGGLLAFSFWPLYLGRFAAEGVGVLLWEMLVLLALGVYRRSRSKDLGMRAAAVLGLLTGLGFYVHLHWPVVALLVGLAVLGPSPADRGKRPWREMVAFLAPVLLLPLPLVGAVLRSPFGDYLKSISLLEGGHGYPTGLGTYLYTAGSYLTCLFWGVDLKYFAYKPFWGGFLNPLLGTFFGIGLIECSRHVSDRRIRWVLLAFPVFFIPALLTNDLETFRIIQVLPLLLVVTAVGIRGTLLQVKMGARPWLLALVLAASLGMDIHHLTGPYAGFWKKNPLQWGDYAKSQDAYEAYELLRGLRDSQGPGAVLLGTQWDSDDQALLTATFPFNAAVNPSLSLDSVRWAVLFTDSDEAPLFAKAFPEGHYRAAHWGVKNLAASLVWIQSKGLEIVPVTEKDLPLVKKWVRVDRCLEEEFFLELNIPPNSPHGPAIQYMKDHFPVFSGDPLTEYFYWVRMEEICQKAGDDPGELEAMRRVVGRSDLARPYQWYRFAVLLVKSRHFEEARSAFRQAGRLNPSFLPPPAVFQKLDEEIAKGKQAL